MDCGTTFRVRADAAVWLPEMVDASVCVVNSMDRLSGGDDGVEDSEAVSGMEREEDMGVRMMPLARLSGCDLELEPG